MASLAASAVQQQKHAFLRAWLRSFDREHLFSIFESNAFALEDLDDPDTSASDFFEAVCDCDADGGGDVVVFSGDIHLLRHVHPVHPKVHRGNIQHLDLVRFEEANL